MRRRAFLQKLSLAALGAATFPEVLRSGDPQQSRLSFPFTDSEGNPFLLEGKNPSLDERVCSAVTDTLAEAKRYYETEYAAVEANIAARKNRLLPYIKNFSQGGSWHRPGLEDEHKKPLRLRTGPLNPQEESLLHDVEFFGRELTNPSNIYRYDPTWTRSLQERFQLRPTDCTHYVLESYATATADKELLEAYLNRTYKPQAFPWVFAMRLKKDYETIMVVPDTKSEERYFNGSTNGWSNKHVMENIRKGWYYTATDYSVIPAWFRKRFLDEYGLTPGDGIFDYYVIDEQTRNPSFRKFIERTNGIGIKHEFVHVQLFNGNDLYEAGWGNNPLYADTFEKTKLYERLHSQGEDKIHNIVLWAPKGTVKAHLERVRREESPLQMMDVKGLFPWLTPGLDVNDMR